MARVTATISSQPKAGANLETHLNDLRSKMLAAAENLEFEEAADIGI